MNVAIFSSNRLGDGLLMMIVAYNYVLAGHQVTFYHDTLGQLQKWFPDSIVFKKWVDLKNLDSEVKKYDLAIAEYHYDSKVRALESFRLHHADFPLYFIYFYQHSKRIKKITKNDFLVRRNHSIVEGLVEVTSHLLPDFDITKKNGLTPPSHLVHRKYKQRVAVHPTSSMQVKNWGQHQFYRLACLLKSKEYEVVFCLGKNEMENWTLPDSQFEKKTFETLEDLASFIFESGYFVGNDSGLAHLASNLNIPTVTIFSRRSSSIFWRPNWLAGTIVLPYFGVPNLKFLRLRDKIWKFLVPVSKVFKNFEDIVKKFP